jgi:hypothetical protein
MFIALMVEKVLEVKTLILSFQRKTIKGWLKSVRNYICNQFLMLYQSTGNIFIRHSDRFLRVPDEVIDLSHEKRLAMHKVTLPRDNCDQQCWGYQFIIRTAPPPPLQGE